MSTYSARNGIAGIMVVLLILTLFGAYIALASSNGATGENQILAQSSCQSPYPQRPANNVTYLHNGTVETTGWLAVLLMPEDTIGQICINYSNNLNNLVQSKVYDSVNKLNGIAISPTSQPSISANPSKIYLYLGSSQAVTYTINSGSNTTGIYNVGMLESCPGTPLAVGYQESELNVSNFSYFLGVFSCPAIELFSTIVGVSNIQVDYLPVHSSYTMTYNITNSSVVSINPSPTVQNVTFNLQVESYASSININYDSKTSSIARFSLDPNLSQSPSACSWYPNNNQAFDNAVWVPLQTTDSGNVTVKATPLEIPAYSVANYSFSILLTNLSRNYYYALGPSISIVAAGGNGSTAQSIGAYYPVNIGRSDFDGSESQLLSGSC